MNMGICQTDAHLLKIAIQATDGEIGTVDQFHFDDETWAIGILAGSASRRT
jgi:hypothetical protein